MMNEVLVVDDNADIRLLISGILNDKGFTVREAANFDQAIIEIEKKLPDVAVIDVKLDKGDNDGIELLTTIKKKNEDFAKDAFEKRVREAKETAIKENIKMAKKSGNKLTQNIDKNGNLIGVNNTIEQSLGKKGGEITTADIKKELFEGENIVIPKKEKGPRKFNADGKRD